MDWRTEDKLDPLRRMKGMERDGSSGREETTGGEGRDEGDVGRE